MKATKFLFKHGPVFRTRKVHRLVLERNVDLMRLFRRHMMYFRDDLDALEGAIFGFKSGRPFDNDDPYIQHISNWDIGDGWRIVITTDHAYGLAPTHMTFIKAARTRSSQTTAPH